MIGILLAIWLIPSLFFFASKILFTIKTEIRKHYTSSKDLKLEQAFAGIGAFLGMVLMDFFHSKGYLFEIVSLSSVFLVFCILKDCHPRFSIRDKIYKGKIGFPIALQLGFILGLWFFTILKGADMMTNTAFAFALMVNIGVVYFELKDEDFNEKSLRRHR